MTGRLPLVGRTTELSRVLRAVADHRGVVLLGAAGVGKTRLATEAVERLRRTGHRVRECHATAAASIIPFGALATLLPADLRGGNPLRHAVDCVEPGLVLAVDDAHLLDQASVALLQHLLRYRDTRLVLTARTMPWQTDALARLEIGNLDREATDELVTEVLGERSDSVVRRVMWTRSGGNPLYLSELLKAGARPGELGQRLTEVVGASIGRLDGPQRHALELLSFGEPLDVDVFLGLTEPAAVDELEERGLVIVKSGTVRMGHPLYGELLRATCPATRSHAHQRRLAESGAGDLLRIATWLLDSDSDITVDQLAEAAAQAWVARDADLAERFCRAAVDRGGAIQVGPTLGAVMLYGRVPDEADVTLAELMKLASNPLEHALLGVTRAFNLFFGLGKRAEAEAVLASVDQPELPAELLHRIGLVRLTWTAQCEPVEVARAQLAAFEAMELPKWAATTARFVEVVCDLQSGRYLNALATLRSVESDAAAVRGSVSGLDDGFARLKSLCLLHSGALVEAESYARDVRAELADDPRNLYAEVAVVSVLSRCALLRGQAGTALELALEAASFPRNRPIVSDLIALCELVRSAALHGRTELATEALVRAEAARRPAWPISGLQVDLARPWLLAATGLVTEAAASALVTAETARSFGAHGVEAIALHDAARFGSDTSARLRELAAALGDPLTGAYAAHALGRATGEADTLDAAATAFEKLGTPLFAAEALAERVRRHGGGVAGHRLAVLLDSFDGVELGTLRAPSTGRLTPRQREVAQLAISGLTSRQIAERLGMSKRTVDNHLYAAYTSLGIGSRSELRAALRSETALHAP